MKPLVSIIMPTYNTKKEYLKEAIDSVMNQSYDFYEFIIIDDCSLDDYKFINENYNDKRIRLFKNQMNLGVANTLNKGLDLANGEYIVRMDSDDIAHSERISKQMRFLEENPTIDIVGTSIEYIGSRKGIRTFPEKSDEIKSSLFFGSPLVHPSVMFRAKKINKYNIRYNPNFKAEDYELWTRCAGIDNFNFSNYSEILLKYRIHNTQVTKTTKENIKLDSNLVRLEYIKSFGLQFTTEEMDKFNLFSQGDSNFSDFILIEELLHRIISKNMVNKKIESNILEKVITKKIIKEYLRKLVFLKKSVKSYKYSKLIKKERKYYYFLKIGSFFCFR